mmetsp:Transcript_83071/g.235345  ORF Transcript_83071/g.235345 Transcript_83071/m.235345 type:complete len:334 (+) Transcript_83071:51-1052(+)
MACSSEERQAGPNARGKRRAWSRLRNVRMAALTCSVGSDRDASRAERLCARWHARSCGRPVATRSRTLRICAPRDSAWQAPMVLSPASKSIHASRMSSAGRHGASAHATSSSSDHRAGGHSRSGLPRLSLTEAAREVASGISTAPWFRCAKHRTARCRYSIPSESRLSSTAGSRYAPVLPPAPLRCVPLASFARGEITTASTSSRARSATLPSGSSTSGSTQRLQSSDERAPGHALSSNEALPMDDFRTRTEPSHPSRLTRSTRRWSAYCSVPIPSTEAGTRIKASKRTSAARRTKVFSSLAAAKNSCGRPCGCDHTGPPACMAERKRRVPSS